MSRDMRPSSPARLRLRLRVVVVEPVGIAAVEGIVDTALEVVPAGSRRCAMSAAEVTLSQGRPTMTAVGIVGRTVADRRRSILGSTW